MRVAIRGAAPPFEGTLRPPADKSVTHRALLLAGLADGVTEIRRPLDSADTRATRALVARLGARVEEGKDGSWRVAGPAVAGRAGAVDCAASGSTARMGIGWLLALGAAARLDGDVSLRRRPMGRVTRPLARLGARFAPSPAPSSLPLEVSPSRLRGGRVDLEVASAQVATALALAALGAEEPLTLSLPAGTRDHTWRLLGAFGAAVRRSDLGAREVVTISPGLPLLPREVEVPGDPSSALYGAVLAASLPGARLRLEGVSTNPTRSAALAALRLSGASVAVEPGGGSGEVEPAGRLRVEGRDRLEAIEVAPHEVPGLVDEIPALAVLAARARGRSRFRGLGELRVKESDRVAATARLLASFGVPVAVEGDDLVIEGGAPLEPARVEPAGDHRIAMAGALLAALAPGESVVEEAECVAQSYPRFFDDLRALLGEERVVPVT